MVLPCVVACPKDCIMSDWSSWGPCHWPCDSQLPFGMFIHGIYTMAQKKNNWHISPVNCADEMCTPHEFRHSKRELDISSYFSIVILITNFVKLHNYSKPDVNKRIRRSKKNPEL